MVILLRLSQTFTSIVQKNRHENANSKNLVDQDPVRENRHGLSSMHSIVLPHLMLFKGFKDCNKVLKLVLWGNLKLFMVDIIPYEKSH